MNVLRSGAKTTGMHHSSPALKTPFPSLPEWLIRAQSGITAEKHWNIIVVLNTGQDNEAEARS